MGHCSGVWLLHVLLLHRHWPGLPWGLLRLSLAEQRLQAAQSFESESCLMTLNGSCCLPANLQDTMHGVMLQEAGGTRMPRDADCMLAGSRGASAGRDCCTSPAQWSRAWLAGCFSRNLSGPLQPCLAVSPPAGAAAPHSAAVGAQGRQPARQWQPKQLKPP